MTDCIQSENRYVDWAAEAMEKADVPELPDAVASYEESARNIVKYVARYVNENKALGVTYISIFVDVRFIKALAAKLRSKGYTVTVFGADGEVLQEPPARSVAPTDDGNFPEFEVNISW